MRDWKQDPGTSDLVTWPERQADEDAQDRREWTIGRTAGNNCPGCNSDDGLTLFLHFLKATHEWVLLLNRCPICR